ncbi:MAG: alpha/beta fold hydrolase [Hymenobacteraceae bacterium]|nr:alpha/beta fold hydrolase [Hymenobacteraceae bacterium]
MPLIPTPAYRPPALLWNGHLQTIVPALLRTVSGVAYVRERLELPDGDFLDLDWHRPHPVRPTTVAIVSHGLEGDSHRPYVRGMAQALGAAGADVLAWNYRSCGTGGPNRLLRAYHLADTADLHTVLTHALATGPYQTAWLVGFSAGGNITLKYLGEDAAQVPRAVVGAAAFSAPVDLGAGARHISRWQNRVYLRRFLTSLRGKLALKAGQHPGALDLTGYATLRSFEAFDERYTAPLHGFASAAAYYAHASSRQYLAGIRIPTLLVQALNDPFLPWPACYPVAEAEASAFLHLEIPRGGGHCGFAETLPGRTGIARYYSDRRAVEFLRAQAVN